MAQWGSSGGLISQNISQTIDNQGNPIISSATEFGSSPLGYAPLVQSLFGLPNATFELTPPDTTASISQSNPLPYWDVQEYSEGVMTAQCLFDSTTNTWGVKLDPGTAVANDYLTLTTRSFLVNDDNLQLRQQALAVVSKSGTYAGTTEWNLELLASYYSATNTLLQSGTVATIYDNGTWTSMSGTTTTGGTAISASAHYVDLTFRLNATATVSSSTAVTIKSCLLQTSARNTNSFIVKETFTSSTTWNIPTNVTQLVGAAVLGAGGGGGSGAYARSSANVGTAGASGGAGGGGGALYIAFNTPISGSALTISVGATGSGGTVTAAGTGAFTSGNAGGAGGNSSIGSIITANGGAGGAGGTAYRERTTQVAGTPTGGAAGTPGNIIWGALTSAGAAGGNGASMGTAIFGAASAGGTSALGTYSGVPFLALPGTGSAGATATRSGTEYTEIGTGGGGGSAQFLGGGGGGGGGSASYNGTLDIGQAAISAAGAGNHGGGGGGGGIASYSTQPETGTAGAGGSAAANSGGGGGGGGGAANAQGSTKAAAGGAGSNGLVVIFYVG
jgi:hypothetical protein